MRKDILMDILEDPNKGILLENQTQVEAIIEATDFYYFDHKGNNNFSFPCLVLPSTTYYRYFLGKEVTEIKKTRRCEVDKKSCTVYLFKDLITFEESKIKTISSKPLINVI